MPILSKSCCVAMSRKYCCDFEKEDERRVGKYGGQESCLAMFISRILPSG